MKTFFDTSVLIAAFLGDHPHHGPSLKAFSSMSKKQAACAAHSLAEVYAVMTRLPVKPLIPPEQAMLFLQDIRDRLTIISLNEADYDVTLKQAAARGITGGQIYDALLLRCAINVKAEVIYTWNLDHFQHISPELARKIQNP